MSAKIVIKLVVIGAGSTGKTLFIQYIISGVESCDFGGTMATTGASYASKDVIYNNKVYKLEIWDTAGNERYKALLKIFFKDANMVYILFDYNHKDTFTYAKSLYDYVKEESNVDNLVCIFVGNKYDSAKEWAGNDYNVSEEEVFEYIEKKNLILTHVSIKEKYSSGIDELFKKSINEYMKKTKTHKYE